MKRFDERKEDLEKAYNRLQEAIDETSKNDVNDDVLIDGVLHRFEFTFELAWKTMKDYLEYQGIIDKIGSPRGVIQQAFSSGLVEDGEVWLDMMLSRNELSHLYDEQESRDIYDKIKNEYVSEIKNLIEKLNQK